MALQSQWRIAPSGIRLGLDYQAVATVLELLGIEAEDRRVTFDGLRVMEGAALEIFEHGRRDPKPFRNPPSRR